MKRIYNLDLPVIAITGGIATGKSYVSKTLKDQGEDVLDADALVKEIYSFPETIEWLEKVFPESIQDKKINFKKLRQAFFKKEKLKKKIELFIYPRLESLFLKKVSNEMQYVFYDVPLLYEKRLHTQVDAVILVHCKRSEQIRRLCKRDSIDEELAKVIIENQLDIDWKKKQENYKINNDLTEQNEFKDLDSLIIKTVNQIKKDLKI